MRVHCNNACGSYYNGQMDATSTNVISLLVTLALGSFWFWMCWDMVHNDDLNDTERGLWGMAFVFLSMFAAGYYYFTEYRRYRHK